ncbi:hypothetical protein C1646_672621 [Rhizophagus diaphanus]|nr:hypothetical protein C1646_672621 [Rhizophagus diaphanus] [Rhizophagus sp. MUCL 43196]
MKDLPQNKFVSVCREDLCEDEKFYIIEWVEEYKNKHPFDLKIKSGKMRSENKVKNHYYLKVRQPSKVDVSPQDSNVPKSVPSSPQDNNVSTTVSPLSKDNNVLKKVSSINNIQERQVSEKMKISSLLI